MSVAAYRINNDDASTASSQEASNQYRKSNPIESMSGSLSAESNWNAGTRKHDVNESVSNDDTNSEENTKKNAQSATAKIAGKHTFEGMVESAARRGKIKVDEESSPVNEKNLSVATIVAGVIALGVSCYTLYRAIADHNDTSLGFSIAGIVVSTGLIVGGAVRLARQ